MTRHHATAAGPVAFTAEEEAEWDVAEAAQAIATARLRAHTQREAIYQEKLAGGAPVSGGLHVGLGDGSRADFTAMGATATAVALGVSGVTWPVGYQQGWITVENQRIPLPTPADGLALAAQVGPYYSAIVQRNRDLKDAIDAAGDEAAVQTVVATLTQGWPQVTSG